MSSGWTMEIGFDMGVAPDPLYQGTARQLQVGGIYRVVPEKVEVLGLCSLDGIQPGDTLVFYIVDISDSGLEQRRIKQVSLNFMTSSYEPVDTAQVITGVPDHAKNRGTLPSQFFGPNLNSYQLQSDSVHQFMVNYPEPAHLFMQISLLVENSVDADSEEAESSALEVAEFRCQQEIFIN